MGRRKNIALFVAMIENEFSHAICEGALLATKEMDANLYIIPAGIVDAVYDDVEANSYRYQYNTLYSCAQYKDIDAVVIEYGSITSHMNHERTLEFLQQIGDVPIILLAGEEEGYSSICIDNRAGLEKAIEHLIIQKQCKKIGFVSGPVDKSQDAVERLETFKETMHKNNLPVDDDWIVYGNFSEFSEDIVEGLINKHPDIEAIVFANDQMAAGGYKAMRRMGLEPGKDVLVTGFDDSPVAKLLEPHLTTVKVDAKELAYRAILACPNIIKGQAVHQIVNSKLIVRESTSTSNADVLTDLDDDLSEQMNSETIKRFADDIFNRFFDVYFESSETLHMKTVLENYFNYYINLVQPDGSLRLNQSEFIKEYIDFSLIYKSGYIDLYQFYSISYHLHEYLTHLIKSEKDRLLLMQAMTSANHVLMSSVTTQQMISDEKNKTFEIMLACVTRDMLQFSKEDKKKYETVIDKLQKMKFNYGCIYTYGRGIEHLNGEVWNVPECMYVKAYHIGEETHLYKGKEKRIKTNSVFSSQLLPRDRRYDMLVTPLFSGEEQYGLLVTEATADNLHHASQIASQVSVAIEVMEIVKKQNAIKKELEKNLAETVANNRMLDEMTRSDHLTGVLNRRGFLSTVKAVIEDERNFGKKAIAIYADMDNLKIINDEFGHDEGDYSLKTIAQALTESFRQSDVVARMGGDEFAAFAIVNQEHFPETIKKRIHSVLKRMNDTNDKVYHIDMSVGSVEFIISKESNIDHLLNEADMDLYVEKKSKKKQVYK